MFLSKRARAGLLLVLLAGAPALLPVRSQATTFIWIGGSGTFSNPANWSGGRVPGTGGFLGLLDVANINTLSPVTVTYDLTDSFTQLNIGLSGAAPGLFNTLSIANTGLTTGLEQIGALGAGAVNQSGGFNTIKTELRLGQDVPDSGSYTLSGGTLSVNQKLYVGNAGSGTLSQGGGTTTVGSALEIGFASTANGAYVLNGTGTLTAASGEDIGTSGTGSFNQGGGTHTVTGGIIVATNAGSSGTYTLSNGNLAINSNGLTVGNFGAGTFNQSGGSNSLTGPSALIVGAGAGSNGTYTLGAGSLSVAGGVETIGGGGTGSFNQSGGTNTLGGQGQLTLGANSGSNGTYTLSGGSLNFNGGIEVVGDHGAGTFNQTNGNNLISNGSPGSLYLGNQAGSSGTYNMSGGAIEMTVGAQYVGALGSGNFQQSGGSNQAPALYAGYLPGGNGTYRLTGTGLLTGNLEQFGVSGVGTMFHDAGINSMESLVLGVNAGSSGVYNLSGTGSLLTNTSETVGNLGTGTVNQSGGTNTTATIFIGANPGGVGTYNLSGGSVFAGSVFLGGNGLPEGTGVLNVSGGELTISTALTAVPGTGSSVNLSGGAIHTPILNFFGTPSNFTWTGGTLHLTTSVTFDAANEVLNSTSGAFGFGLSLGANQTLEVTGNETLGGLGPFSLTLNDGSTHLVTGNIILNATGNLTQNDGSTLLYSTLTQAGGAINGTLQNAGNFVYQSGQFNGRLINLGTATLGSNFTAGNGIENDTSLNLATGQTLTVNGTGLDNFGTLTMTGGRINGNGGVVNDVGGLMQISGAAAINTAFTNLGELHVNGLLTLSSGGINSGITTIAAGGGIRGGAFTNDGTLTLSGGGISSVSTTNAAAGVLSGTGGISGTFANGAGGIVQVASGNTLTIAHDWSNAGLVTMQGGTLGPSAISNSGVIQGSGIIGGAVTNTGTLRAAGGELEIAGASTNATGGQIQVSAGSTLLFVQGLAANAGTIALSGGTFDNGNAAMTNTGSILGAGTVRTGGLLNQGSISFADAPTSVFGSLTTDASGGGGNVHLSDNTTTFFGPVTVGAGTTFEVTHGTARFLSSFTNNGTYLTDPSTSSFTNLTIGASGSQVGESGDVYLISGNLVNQSTRSSTFDLSQTQVEFTGTTSHKLGWSGADFGPQYFGYVDNFALATLELAAGSSLMLFDASGLTRTSGGLYIGTLRLDGGLRDTTAELQAFIRASLTNIDSGDVLNLYYDPLQIGNSYLGGMTFSLGGGGFLEPVQAQAEAPEPSTTGMLLLPAVCVCLLRRRPRRER